MLWKVWLLQEKEMTQNLQNPSKSPLAVNNTHSENQDVLNSSNLSAGMKTYVGTIRSEEEEILYCGWQRFE